MKTQEYSPKKVTIFRGVAGCGKTKRSLDFAEENINLAGLMLTFNKILQQDTEKKAIVRNLNNLQIKTLHGFAFSSIFQKTFKVNDN
jgi:hypothetical protein